MYKICYGLGINVNTLPKQTKTCLCLKVHWNATSQLKSCTLLYKLNIIILKIAAYEDIAGKKQVYISPEQKNNKQLSHFIK